MARQNFLSKESFVAATEKQVKDSLFCIPAFASNIRLVAENKMIESIRFSYEDLANAQQFFIDVTVLPLNDQYMRVSLKGTYVSGKILEDSAALAIVLHDFESAIDAALKDDISLYHPNQPRQSSGTKLAIMATTMAASIGWFFLKKKLS